MKNANQMKEITYKHSKIIQWVEENLSAEIEKAAEAGSRKCSFETPLIYKDLTKEGTFNQIKEYLEKFDYTTSVVGKFEKIWVYW